VLVCVVAYQRVVTCAPPSKGCIKSSNTTTTTTTTALSHIRYSISPLIHVCAAYISIRVLSALVCRIVFVSLSPTIGSSSLNQFQRTRKIRLLGFSFHFRTNFFFCSVSFSVQQHTPCKSAASKYTLFLHTITYVKPTKILKKFGFYGVVETTAFRFSMGVSSHNAFYFLVFTFRDEINEYFLS